MILEIILIILFDGHHSSKSVYFIVGLSFVLTTLFYYPSEIKLVAIGASRVPFNILFCLFVSHNIYSCLIASAGIFSISYCDAFGSRPHFSSRDCLASVHIALLT